MVDRFRQAIGFKLTVEPSRHKAVPQRNPLSWLNVKATAVYGQVSRYLRWLSRCLAQQKRIGIRRLPDRYRRQRRGTPILLVGGRPGNDLGLRGIFPLFPVACTVLPTPICFFLSAKGKDRRCGGAAERANH